MGQPSKRPWLAPVIGAGLVAAAIAVLILFEEDRDETFLASVGEPGAADAIHRLGSGEYQYEPDPKRGDLKNGIRGSLLVLMKDDDGRFVLDRGVYELLDNDLRPDRWQDAETLMIRIDTWKEVNKWSDGSPAFQASTELRFVDLVTRKCFLRSEVLGDYPKLRTRRRGQAWHDSRRPIPRRVVKVLGIGQ